MSRKMRLFLLPLLLWFLLASGPAPTSAQTYVNIQGTVRDASTSNPIPNATVIIWDVWGYKGQTIWTNASGAYSVNVTSGNKYRVYIYHDEPSTLGFDYVPKKSADFTATQTVTNLSCTLLPGASVSLHGTNYYVRSTTQPPRFYVDVLEALKEEPPIPPYPEDANFTNIWTLGSYGDALKLRIINIAVVPAEISVDLKIQATGTGKDPKMGVVRRPFEFKVDNKGSHYNLSQGDLVSADLSWYSIAMSITTMRNLWDDASEEMREMERAGFYLGVLRTEMGTVSTQINDAEDLLTQGKLQEAFKALEDPYFTITVKLQEELERMWLIAQSSAVIMPLFPAFFAVTMGFFLFEKLRRKIIASFILYGVSNVLLYFVYPGYQIVELRLLLILTSSIFAIVLFAVFGLPRLIKEPDIPGPYPFRAVLSVVFSMGKRNVKRRLSRGVLTIASLTVLVLAFTTFTSFGRVLGIVTERPDVTPPADGILIRNLPLAWAEVDVPYLRIETQEAYRFQNESGVTLVSPLVWNEILLDQWVGVLSKEEGNEFSIYGILGVDPSTEATITHIDQAVTRGNLSDLEAYGAIVSQEAADHLKVDVGDILPFYLPTGSYNLTIVGIFDSPSLSELIDLDGDSILPWKKVAQDNVPTYTRTDASEVLILNWETCLESEKPLEEITQISRIVVQIEGLEPEDFVRDVITGREYTCWVSADGKVTKFALGHQVEMGGFTLLVPLAIVLLNVGLVMISIVSERTQDIFTLTCVGFNPTHITALFLAESIVMGLVGGGVGYLLGMSSYRILNFLAELNPTFTIAVRQKLEWYWSVIGVLLAVGVAVLSAVRPASRAVMSVTPSLVKKIKIVSKKKRIEREEEVWKIYQAQTISMPIRVHEREELFFSSYLSTRMKALKTGLVERVSDYSETEEETPTGDRVKRFTFTYSFTEETGPELASINELVAMKKSGQDHYILSLIAKPKTPGLPGTWLDRTTRFVRDILGDWEEEKSTIMGEA